MPRRKSPHNLRKAQVQSNLREIDKERVMALAEERGKEVSELIRDLLLAEVEAWEQAKAKQERR